MNRQQRRAAARKSKLGQPPRGKRWSWTQSICDDCWKVYGDPLIEPRRITEANREKDRCGWCGDIHESGIYTRQDPRDVPYPRLEWIQ